MSKTGWLLLVVGGVVVIGFFIVQSQSFANIRTSSGSQSTLSSVASIFGSTKSIFGDVEKAFPSWFSSGDEDPTPDNLSKYASTAGLFDRTTVDAN